MAHPQFMTESLDEKKFEARIPLELWEEYEDWAKGRAKLSNPDILIAFLRLFLHVPDWARLLAIYGKGDQLAALENLRPEELPPPPTPTAEAEQEKARELMGRARAREARPREKKAAGEAKAG